jgi:hypothetical protein
VLIRRENRVIFDEGTVTTLANHEHVKDVEADQEVRIQ